MIQININALKMNVKISLPSTLLGIGLLVSPSSSLAIDPLELQKLGVKGSEKIGTAAPSTGQTISFKDIEKMKSIQDSMDANDIEYTALKGGVSYREFREGKGTKVVKAGDIVTAELTVRAKSFATRTEPGGVLLYSTKDDTPYNAIEIPINGNGFLPGVQDALIGMKRQSIRRIEVPSTQVFKARDQGGLPVPVTDDHKRRMKNLFKTDATLIVEVLVDKIAEAPSE